jgi:V8-like Glu-specific endopeptidase
MLELSSRDRKVLRGAIETAYPDPDDLSLFVDEELNENLAAIATGNLRIKAFDLIQWARARGYLEDLILAIARDKPNRLDIQQFCAKVLRQRVWLNAEIGDRSDSFLSPDLDAWGIDPQAEQLESFFPRQFSYEADVGLLRDGLDCSSAVCKITFSDRSPTASGTGVLIAPDLVLTNYHVLSRQDNADLNAIARTAQIQFGYISTHFGQQPKVQVVKLAESNPVVSASPIAELDYALIRIAPGTDFHAKPVRLNSTAQLEPRSPLNILQHPEGEQLKVSLSNNGVVKINQSRGLVLYVNKTNPGSSGSPCFDDDWKLVALHHKGLQTSFGSIREGILWSAIHQHIVHQSPDVLTF